MILKIIALGFFTRRHSYLRSYWNILDFLIVIFGWISYSQTFEDFKAFRVLRVLKPLSLIQHMPGMRSLASMILKSGPKIFDILVLLMIMIVIFSTIFIQLLGGKLENKLRDTFKFDNIFISSFNIFQLCTLEGWTKRM